MWSRQVLSNPDIPGVCAPTLFIGQAAWDMLQAYVNGVGESEINGFGYVTHNTADGNFYWVTADDVFITKQKVTQGTADVTGADFSKALYQAMLTQREDHLHVQWHSHVWGEAYHSSKDTATIAAYGRAGMTWFISVVTNKHGNVTARLDRFRPHRMGVPMQVTVLSEIEPGMLDRARADIEALVTIKEPEPKVTTISVPTKGKTVIRP